MTETEKQNPCRYSSTLQYHMKYIFTIILNIIILYSFQAQFYTWDVRNESSFNTT